MSYAREYLLALIAVAGIAVAACPGADLGSPIPKDEVTLLRELAEENKRELAEIKAMLTKLTAPKVEAPVTAKVVPSVPKPVASAPSLPAQYLTTQVTTAHRPSSGVMGKLKGALGCSSPDTSSTAVIQYTVAPPTTYTLAPSARQAGGTTRVVGSYLPQG